MRTVEEEYENNEETLNYLTVPGGLATRHFSRTFSTGEIGVKGYAYIGMDVNEAYDNLNCGGPQGGQLEPRFLIDLYEITENGQMPTGFSMVVNESDGSKIAKTPRLKPNTNYIIKVSFNQCIGGTLSYRSIKVRDFLDNLPVGGVRLKRQKNFDGNQEEIKRYYYNKYDSIDISSGDVGLLEDDKFPLNYNYESMIIDYCPPFHPTPTPNSGIPDCTYSYQVVNNMVSSSLQSLFNSGGNNIYYQYVSESLGGDNFEKGNIEHEFIINRDGFIKPFINDSDFSNLLVNHGDKWTNSGFKNGMEKVTSYFTNSNEKRIKSIEREYSIYGRDNRIFRNIVVNKLFALEPGCYPDPTLYTRIMNNYSIGYYGMYAKKERLSKEIQTEYIDNIELTTTTDYYYNNPSHYQLTDQKITFPDGSSQLTNYKYAEEKGKTKLIEANMVGIPLETTVVKKQSNTDPGTMVAKSETLYPDVLPDPQTGNLLLPKSVSSLDLETQNLSTDVTYDKYDSKGNLEQYTTKSGVSTTIIWGYNNTQPIAKIEGATYSQISGLAATMVTASDADASAGVNNDETSLLALMKTFREALASYQVTTYTYDPLVGVRSIRPPNGIRQVYIYDTANRLMEVRENNQTGNLLKEYKYNYK